MCVGGGGGNAKWGCLAGSGHNPGTTLEEKEEPKRNQTRVRLTHTFFPFLPPLIIPATQQTR